MLASSPTTVKSGTKTAPEIESCFCLCAKAVCALQITSIDSICNNKDLIADTHLAAGDSISLVALVTRSDGFPDPAIKKHGCFGSLTAAFIVTNAFELMPHDKRPTLWTLNSIPFPRNRHAFHPRTRPSGFGRCDSGSRTRTRRYTTEHLSARVPWRTQGTLWPGLAEMCVCVDPFTIVYQL